LPAGTETRSRSGRGRQTPFNLREDLARVFEIPEERIRVVLPADGGSFGGEDVPSHEAMRLRWRARRAGREARRPRQRGVGDGQPHAATIEVKLGARADGRSSRKP